MKENGFYPGNAGKSQNTVPQASAQVHSKRVDNQVESLPLRALALLLEQDGGAKRARQFRAANSRAAEAEKAEKIETLIHALSPFW